MTDISKEAVDALLQGVTEGPWHVGRGDGQWFVGGGGFARVDMTGPLGDHEANAIFIAAARELVPAQAAKIETQAAEIAALRAALDEAEAALKTDLIRREDALAVIADKNAWPKSAAIAALPAVTVGVKPLFWFRNGRGWAAHTPFGLYEVEVHGPRTHVLHGGSFLSKHEDPETAQAAAQADYTARILSALTPTPVDASQTPDPVVNAPDPAAIRAPTLGTCSCGMTGPCMWDQCKHHLVKGAAE